MSDNPIDDAGSDMAQMLRIMLQIATLIQLRTRTRGEQQAQAIGKEHNAAMKVAREKQLREARQSKARDPRNQELARMLDVPPPSPGVSLQRQLPGYGTPAYRAAVAASLTRHGVAPELATVRMLTDLGQGRPPTEAVMRRPEPADRTAQRSQQIDERRRALALAQQQGRAQ